MARSTLMLMAVRLPNQLGITPVITANSPPTVDWVQSGW